MKEKILKLVQSSVWEDVLIGLELAYTLDSETFKEMFGDYIDFTITYDAFMFFQRDGIYYVFGKYFLFPWPYKAEDKEMFENWKDLTPKL